MKLLPRTRKDFERVALEVLIGANIALQVPNLAEAISQSQPAPTIDLRSPSTDEVIYKDLPRARYQGLVPFSDAEKGTVKFVASHLAYTFCLAEACKIDQARLTEMDGPKIPDCPSVTPEIEFNFKYKIAVTDRNQHMFDYKSKTMQSQPSLQNEYEQVLRGFCAQYKDDHRATRYCTASSELAIR